MVWMIVALVVLVLGWILIYNSLIGRKNEVENIFGSMDTLLKKRFDLVPNLVATASRYLEHEKGILENVTALRAQGMRPNLSEVNTIAIDQQMSASLGALTVAVENYPELKANEEMIHLQQSLFEIEEQISAARRAYNQTVTDYNNAIEMFPSSIVASSMHLLRKEVFEIPLAERQNVDVNALFKR